jgi:mono/diheme cytochrome c family protein
MRIAILALHILAVCIAAVPAAVLAPPSALAQDAPRAPAAQIEHGRALFLADGCAACHGTVGQGSRVSGPRLAPHTMPLQPFLHILRHPANNMPPYVAEVLSDADASDIHAYLDSLPGPIQKVQDIPALNR